MQDWYVKLFEAAPIAGAMIYLVIVFLRAMDRRDDRINQAQKDWSACMTESLERSNAAMDRSSTALYEIKGTIEGIKAVIEKCKRVQEG